MSQQSSHIATNKAYDRYVTLMQVGLTLVAAILAILIAFWPMINSDEMSFTLSYDDVITSDDVIRMKKPKYTGTDAIDRLFTVEASEGVQLNPNEPVVQLNDIAAEMELDAGRVANAYSDIGTYSLNNNQLTMAGDVHMHTTDGYAFKANEAIFDLNNKYVQSTKAVNGNGPLGAFSANGFYVDVDRKLVIFNGKVTLRINPLGEELSQPTDQHK